MATSIYDKAVKKVGALADKGYVGAKGAAGAASRKLKDLSGPAIERFGLKGKPPGIPEFTGGVNYDKAVQFASKAKELGRTAWRSAPAIGLAADTLDARSRGDEGNYVTGMAETGAAILRPGLGLAVVGAEAASRALTGKTLTDHVGAGTVAARKGLGALIPATIGRNGGIGFGGLGEEPEVDLRGAKTTESLAGLRHDSALGGAVTADPEFGKRMGATFMGKPEEDALLAAETKAKIDPKIQAAIDATPAGVAAPAREKFSALKQHPDPVQFGEGVDPNDMVGLRGLLFGAPQLLQQAQQINKARSYRKGARDDEQIDINRQNADTLGLRAQTDAATEGRTASAAAIKQALDNRKEGVDNLRKNLDDTFQEPTPDGKGFQPNKIMQEAFKRFVYAADPRFANLSEPKREALLEDLAYGTQNKFLEDMRADFAVATKINAGQNRSLGGSMTAGPDPVKGMREAEFRDVLSGGLPLKDYLYSNTPLTNKNVVETRGGRTALASDVLENDADRLTSIQRQIALEKRREGLRKEAE